MTGENPEELWHIQQLGLRIILLQRFSVAMDTPMTAIGGVLVLSCSNVKLAGHHSVLKRLMIHIARLSTGVKLFISLKMFSLDLRRRISLEGMSSAVRVDEAQLTSSQVSSAIRKTALAEVQLMRSKITPFSAACRLIHSGVYALLLSLD